MMKHLASGFDDNSMNYVLFNFREIIERKTEI